MKESTGKNVLGVPGVYDTEAQVRDSVRDSMIVQLHESEDEEEDGEENDSGVDGDDDIANLPRPLNATNIRPSFVPVDPNKKKKVALISVKSIDEEGLEAEDSTDGVVSWFKKNLTNKIFGHCEMRFA